MYEIRLTPPQPVERDRDLERDPLGERLAIGETLILEYVLRPLTLTVDS